MRGDKREGSFLPPEENMDLPDFTPECVHVLLREVYGHSLTTTMGCTWTGESRTTPYCSVVDANKPRNWLAGMPRPQEAVGCRFMAILDVE